MCILTSRSRARLSHSRILIPLWWIQIALAIMDKIREVHGSDVPDEADAIYPSGLGRRRSEVLHDFHKRLTRRIEKEDKKTGLNSAQDLED